MTSSGIYLELPDDAPSASLDEQIDKELWRNRIEVGAELAHRLPEHNYWLLSFWTQILPAVISEIKNSISIQMQITGPAFNYLDAAASLVTGIHQLTDDNTHRPTTSKVKGSINIINASQLIILTSINLGALSSPAFAAGTAIEFLLSIEETVRAVRRKASFDYWLKDNLTELEKVSNLIVVLDQEIQVFKQKKEAFEKNEKHSKAADWALAKKESRLAALVNKQNEIAQDVTFRVAEKRYVAFENNDDYANSPAFTCINNQTAAPFESGFCQAFLKKIRDMNQCEAESQLNDMANDKTFLQSDELSKAKDPALRNIRQQAITAKCDAHIKNAVKNNFYWGMALLGTILLCIPTCQLAGLIIIGIASGLYLVDHLNRKADISGKISESFHNGFFHSPKAGKEKAEGLADLENKTELGGPGSK